VRTAACLDSHLAYSQPAVLFISDPHAMLLAPKERYFGYKGGWLVFWITVACATDMTLFGYDQVSKA
jgi:hypothetical protein